VLAGWDQAAAAAGGGARAPLRERRLPFPAIRRLSPAQFVDLLARLGVAGVVCGANYRFGFRAAGDAAELASLCLARGLRCSVLELVADESARRRAEGPPQVSSSAVREALRAGQLGRVEALLGRPHRLHLAPAGGAETGAGLPPRLRPLNQPPRAGRYGCVAWVAEAGEAEGEWGRGLCEAAPAGLELLEDGSARLALLRPADAAAAARAAGKGVALHYQAELGG